MSEAAAEGAERLRRQALTRPGDPVVRARLAAVVEASEAHEVAGEAVRLARACLAAGLVEPARETAALLVAWAPEEGAHAALAIDVALRDGEPAGLAQAAERARAWVARAPSSAEARLRAALVAVATGQAADVLAWLAPVLATSSAARVLHAQAQLASGDARGALAALRLGEGTPDADGCEVAGVAWLELGEPERALDAFTAALAQAPCRPSTGYNMAVAFARAGQLGAALGACDTTLEWLAAAAAQRAEGPLADEARVRALRASLAERLAAGLAPGRSSA